MFIPTIRTMFTLTMGGRRHILTAEATANIYRDAYPNLHSHDQVAINPPGRSHGTKTPTVVNGRSCRDIHSESRLISP